jgi:riboflavin kinase
MQREKKLKGTIFTGTGKGKYFMSQQGYKRQFEKSLGFIPFEGTLNIKVNIDEARDFLKSKKPIIIKGFKSLENDFGGLKCYKIKVKNIKAAIIIPDRTHYNKETLELISKENIRKSLSLNDGNSIELE